MISTLGVSLRSSAQTPAAVPTGIVERIIMTSDSTITFDIPEDLLKDLLPGAVPAPVKRVKKPVTNVPVKEKPKMPGIVSGFRIQIFADGRNQNTLQARARARASQVLGRFPEFRHQVYSFSKAPNWYTRIGNFATRAEAEAVLSRLKAAFPSFSSEIRIVKSDVVVNR